MKRSASPEPKSAKSSKKEADPTKYVIIHGGAGVSTHLTYEDYELGADLIQRMVGIHESSFTSLESEAASPLFPGFTRELLYGAVLIQVGGLAIVNHGERIVDFMREHPRGGHFFYLAADPRYTAAYHSSHLRFCAEEWPNHADGYDPKTTVAHEMNRPINICAQRTGTIDEIAASAYSRLFGTREKTKLFEYYVFEYETGTLIHHSSGDGGFSIFQEHKVFDSIDRKIRISSMNEDSRHRLFRVAIRLLPSSGQ
jgi:hypothetical protein